MTSLGGSWPASAAWTSHRPLIVIKELFVTRLFQASPLGRITLANRIVMAPMTRSRNPDYVANAQTARYYSQRASAGLIVSEGTPISPEGQGYIGVPGIWSPEQVAGWRLVTDAVHAAGGAMFAQIWHVGRMSHASLQPNHGAPVSSTDQAPAESPKNRAYIYLDDGSAGFGDPTPPRRLGSEEIARVVQDYVQAGQNAIAAGFDGIEIHAANGYLIEQFINPLVNDRSDRYGGSLENRTRLLFEVVDALAEAIGADRVGIRLSPNNRQHDMPEYPDNEATYLYIAKALSARGLAYIHLNDNFALGHSVISTAFLQAFRQAYAGCVILAGAMTQERAEQLLAEGLIDLAAFGQPFISNPDLVARLRDQLPLTPPERATYYGGDEKGYTDYPTASVAA